MSSGATAYLINAGREVEEKRLPLSLDLFYVDRMCDLTLFLCRVLGVCVRCVFFSLGNFLRVQFNFTISIDGTSENLIYSKIYIESNRSA